MEYPLRIEPNNNWFSELTIVAPDSGLPTYYYTFWISVDFHNNFLLLHSKLFATPATLHSSTLMSINSNSVNYSLIHFIMI